MMRAVMFLDLALLVAAPTEPPPAWSADPPAAWQANPEPAPSPRPREVPPTAPAGWHAEKSADGAWYFVKDGWRLASPAAVGGAAPRPFPAESGTTPTTPATGVGPPSTPSAGFYRVEGTRTPVRGVATPGSTNCPTGGVG